LPFIISNRKSKSLHLHQDKVINKRENLDLYEKMYNTQMKHFKKNESTFELTSRLPVTVKKKPEISPIKKCFLEKRGDFSSPSRFYEMEKGDDFRRSRNQNCLILKENKYNGHKGLYSKGGNLDLLKLKKNEMKGQEMLQKEENSIQLQLLKELRFQSI